MTMSSLANRSVSMPRLDRQPPDLLQDSGQIVDVGAPRNRQFTVYDRGSSRTLNSSGYNTLTRGQRSGACFEGCMPRLAQFAGQFRHSGSAVDVWRQATSSSRGFWTGINELRSVLTPGNPLLENQMSGATFYVVNPSKSTLMSKTALKMMDEEDQFFKDISALYQRQKVLFQKCCEQLKDIYLVSLIFYLFEVYR